MTKDPSALEIERNIGNFAYPETHTHDAGVGLSEKTIHYISDVKQDPDWVREFRLNAYKIFMSKPMPTHWASKDLEAIVFDNIRYYLSGGTQPKRNWEDVPDDVKRTFERLGIPEQERKFLAGVEAQFDSEAVYSNIKKAVGEQGCIFVVATEGLKNHPEIFRKWFGKVIPIADNKFSALNSAVFSGGSFIYVPPGVKVKHPLQAYFRINAENFGQFDRTLIIANDGQHQDTGAKMIHAADETTSNIISKSISIGKGRATYRGLVHVPKHLKNCKNNTECDALLINSTSRTDTYPAITVRGTGNAVQHEASVSQVSAEQIFYMQQRGLSEAQAMSLSVNGFVNDLVRQFPMEYSVELKRLIELEMEGSVG